jgi:tRNA 2-thiouridine synthesizing protein A
MNFDKELDARGLVGMQPGQVLKVVSTDSGSVADMKAFAETTGHQLLSTETSGKEFVFFLKK